MNCFVDIKEQMKEGDILTLDRESSINSQEIIFFSSIMRNQENICGFPLEAEMVEELDSMFPRIKYYLGFHACHFQAQYHPESKQFSSAMMTGNFLEEDSVLAGLIGNADNLMDSMIELENKIAMLMQESPVLRRITIPQGKRKVYNYNR